MTCASCAGSVESILQHTSGVTSAAVNYAAHSVRVAFNPIEVTEKQLQNAVQSIGYDLVISDANVRDTTSKLAEENLQKLQSRLIFSSLLTLPVFVIGMFFMHMPYGELISLIITTPVLFWFGREFFINAAKQARHGRANMDTLVALSTGIAYVFSAFNTLYPDYWFQRGLEAHVYFEAAAVIITFITLGKWLEEKAKSNTGSAIKNLMGLQVKSLTLIRNNETLNIPIEEVNIGDLVLVKPGEKIAVDGTVIEGDSYVNESMITGEPMPSHKIQGSKVFSGTINQKGSLTFKAEKIGPDTVLGRIIQTVEQAQGSKAPVQKLVDKAAGIFVPIVIIIAIATFLIWSFSGIEDAFAHALLTSITVLVIACPCALGLATPTAIMVGIGKGAEQRILIKDAESLEIAHKVDALILDKTGTITEGHPSLQELHWFTDNQQLRSLFFAMEQKSEHPLAVAIVNSAEAPDTHPPFFTNFESLTGQGIRAQLDGHHYYIGSEALIKTLGINYSSLHSQILQKPGSTAILFANETDILAIALLHDKIKEGSFEAIQNLKKRGIELHMLTGDRPEAAAEVAQSLQIENWQAGVMPSDKAEAVRRLKNQGKTVAMVGDGINDSEALALADLSIAMGKGTDIAMDVARMTLISSDLRAIPTALRLSSNTVKTIRENLFWAFIYNIVGIPIAAGILYPFFGFLLNPMIAAGAMALSSVSVVSNSLRLKWKKNRQ